MESAQNSKYMMTVNNKEIWEFFHENPSIDFENALLILIDMFDMTLKNAENTVNNKINTRIISSLTEQMMQMKELKADMTHMKQEFATFNAEMLNTLMRKLSEIKQEYIEETKTIVACSGSASLDKISSLVDKHNDSFLDKTKLLLTEIVPLTNNAYHRQIQDSLQQFHKHMMDETTQLLSSSPHSLDEFLGNFEFKFTTLTQSLQSPIYNFIAASEERINKNLMLMRDHMLGKEMSQDKLFGELDDFLNKNKYKHSAMRGKTGETQLEDLLNQLFPSALVNNTSGTAASGDFILQEREHGKPTILFETKTYSSNVNTDEILKFLRDVRLHRCHGILLSQTSGIVTKKQFQIEIVDGSIVVYVLNCEYDPEKIKIAVDMVDTLSSCLDTYIHHGDDNPPHDTTSLSRETMQKINDEYSKWSNQKLALVEHLKTLTKEMTKKLTEQIEDMKLPALNTILSTHFGTCNVSVDATADHSLTCKHCHRLWGSKAALASHIKGCAKKNISQDRIRISVTG